jgi:hypothetical protein
MSRRLRAALAAGLAAILMVAFESVPKAQLIDSLTVTLLGAGSVSFPLTRDSAANAGTTTLTARTSWSLVLLRSSIGLDAYFSSSAAALAHGSPVNTVNIPSSRVEVSVNGGPLQPFDQTVAFGAANAGRRLFTQPLTLFNLIDHRDDTIALNINLSGYALPADTYTGLLRLRAQATP